MFGLSKSNGNAAMIRHQIQARGITNENVIRALRQTDRKNFVPDDQLSAAYEDRPIPLMPGSTVSQPYIVALMTDLADVRETDRVLEIGAGSGYQAAVLSRLAAEVWAVEIQPELVAYAAEKIARMKLRNVHIVQGDGWKGYPEAAPFDRIIVAAAPGTVPQPLLDQLAPGGRMIVPVGASQLQELEIIEKTLSGEIRRATHSMVQFVPLVKTD